MSAPENAAPELPRTAEAAEQARQEASADPAEWVERYGDFLLRFALSRVRDRDAAEDLVQETFVAAIRARERFAGESALRTWLVGILRHKILDHYRAKSRTVLADDLVSEGSDTSEDGLFGKLGRWTSLAAPKAWQRSPDSALESVEFRRVLDDCVSKLPDTMARLFMLRDVDEVDSDTVCEMLGITPSNLYTTLHRARFRLRKCLEVNWFGNADSGADHDEGEVGAPGKTTLRKNANRDTLRENSAPRAGQGVR